MAGEDRVLAGGARYIDFQTDPSRYRHWKLDVDGDVATLTMDVDENGGLFEGYQLKLNSYDLGVDIELADAVQRLRFEHPGVKVVLMRSGKNRVFCAGANIRMLAGATHAHKVNFCKFTNETRNGLEDSSENSGQRFVTVINGTAAGGGYELALATDHIILADDGSAAVALPEVPLLAVLPGTGGLTRVVDKRKVRRDHADYFCTIEEGIKGKRAVQWRLVDEIVPNSKLEAKVAERSKEFAAASKRNGNGKGISLSAADAQLRRQRHPLRPCQRRHQSRRAYRHHLDQGAGGSPARRYRRHDRARGQRSGRCRWRANSTTPSCICASTNSIPRCWCSSRMAIAPRCWPATPCWKPTRRIGWSTRSGSTGSGCSSASTSPRARW